MTDIPPVKVPQVARKPRPARTARMTFLLVGLGAGVFAGMARNRAAFSAQAAGLPPLPLVAAVQTAPEPLPVVATPTPPASPPPAAPQAAPVPMVPIAAPIPSGADQAAAERARARLAAPALIVDLAQGRSGDGSGATMLAQRGDTGTVPTAVLSDPTSSAAPGAIAAAGATTAGASSSPSASDLRDSNDNERFAIRAGRRETEVSRAYRLPNQDRLVPLGTVIGAVMETALNSDVPGYARAITTRDVLSFDGSQVVIPAGSHVVGEYKSGVAQGASRIFIVWSRLVRPDGVAVALASPATDDLGGGGLGGKVSRHFLERFGGAVLLSVLTGGLNAFTQSLAHGSTVVVSSTSEATSLAGEASRGTSIPPTIRTMQGAAVRIFVARDLDFSTVGSP